MFLTYCKRRPSVAIRNVAISNRPERIVRLHRECYRPINTLTCLRFRSGPRPNFPSWSLAGTRLHISNYISHLASGHLPRKGPASRMDFCEVPSISCDVPDWLNKQFIEQTLQAGYKDPSLRVAFHEVTPATSPGDNYVSELYRVSIDLCNNGKRRSVIIKCLPTSEYNLKFIHDARLFEKEINFYDVTLPAMRIPDLAPHCLLTRQDMLVLEDLAPLGFTMVNRRQGLDWAHCRAAVTCLARLHARSVDLPQADLMERYPETVYHDYDHASRYIRHSLTSLAGVVGSWQHYERFSGLVLRLAGSALDRLLQLMPRTPPPQHRHLFGLNHGDFWTNNIMFRYERDSGRIAEVRVLDYQMCRYAPLALDLQYLLCTSLREAEQTELEDRLLDAYHAEFCLVLGRADHLTLDQLKQEMRRTDIFGFVNACMMLPVVLADPSEDSPDLANVAASDADTLHWHKGTHFKRQFQKLLIYFEEKGLFNETQ